MYVKRSDLKMTLSDQIHLPLRGQKNKHEYGLSVQQRTKIV